MTGPNGLEARIRLSRTPRCPGAGAAWDRSSEAERAEARAIARRLESLGVVAPLAGEPGYPAALLDLDDAPPVVFVRGALPRPERAVAIVGSRAATPYGVARAGALAASLARLGYVVVSGLARGVDAAAHRGAVEAGGASVAVLPGGIHPVTPRHHAALAGELCARGGGLMSEGACGPPRFRGEFVERNRLIAALAGATVVVEAASRSGALSTAAAARRLGRPVLAVPGDVDRETSRGTHALLRGGAAVCEDAGDVLRALGARGGAARPEGPAAAGVVPAERLRGALGDRPLGVDALAAAVGVPVAEALALLLELEWAGAAVALPGQRWRRPA
jgi:DNA processing protein